VFSVDKHIWAGMQGEFQGAMKPDRIPVTLADGYSSTRDPLASTRRATGLLK